MCSDLLEKAIQEDTQKNKRQSILNPSMGDIKTWIEKMKTNLPAGQQNKKKRKKSSGDIGDDDNDEEVATPIASAVRVAAAAAADESVTSTFSLHSSSSSSSSDEVVATPIASAAAESAAEPAAELPLQPAKTLIIDGEMTKILNAELIHIAPDGFCLVRCVLRALGMQNTDQACRQFVRHLKAFIELNPDAKDEHEAKWKVRADISPCPFYLLILTLILTQSSCPLTLYHLALQDCIEDELKAHPTIVNATSGTTRTLNFGQYFDELAKDENNDDGTGFKQECWASLDLLGSPAAAFVHSDIQLFVSSSVSSSRTGIAVYHYVEQSYNFPSNTDFYRKVEKRTVQMAFNETSEYVGSGKNKKKTRVGGNHYDLYQQMKPKTTLKKGSAAATPPPDSQSNSTPRSSVLQSTVAEGNSIPPSLTQPPLLDNADDDVIFINYMEGLNKQVSLAVKNCKSPPKEQKKRRHSNTTAQEDTKGSSVVDLTLDTLSPLVTEFADKIKQNPTAFAKTYVRMLCKSLAEEPEKLAP